MLRHLLLTGLSLLALTAAGSSHAEDTLKNAFQSPPKSARLALRWWWPGGDVSDAGLATQLKSFDDAHIGALEIQPFRSGLGDVSGPRLARVQDYATPAFFAHVAAAAKDARRLGMDLDYTLGSGWPSGGGAAITPELAQGELRMSTLSITGPLTFDGPLPQIDRDHHGLDFLSPPLPDQGLSDAWKQRLAAREKTVAVIAVKARAPAIKMIAVPGPFPIPPQFRCHRPGRRDRDRRHQRQGGSRRQPALGRAGRRLADHHLQDLCRQCHGRPVRRQRAATGPGPFQQSGLQRPRRARLRRRPARTAALSGPWPRQPVRRQFRAQCVELLDGRLPRPVPAPARLRPEALPALYPATGLDEPLYDGVSAAGIPRWRRRFARPGRLSPHGVRRHAGAVFHAPAQRSP